MDESCVAAEGAYEAAWGCGWSDGRADPQGRDCCRSGR